MTTEEQSIQLTQSVKRLGINQKTVWIGLIFLISLAFRFQDLYVFREFNADKARQLHAAYELLQGKGVSIESYDLNTFQPHTRPLIAWPPGYSYLIAGLSKITGYSVYNASYMFDVLGIIAMWCALVWFAFLLRFTSLQTAILFLLFGFCRTPWTYLLSADVLGTVLFLFSAGLNVHYMQRNGSKGNLVRFVALQFLLVAAMCFFKYSLLPAYAALALSVFSFSFAGKTNCFTTGIILVIIVGASLGLLMLYNNTIATGHEAEMGNLHQKGKGWFFRSLLMFNPFFLNSFIYIEGLRQRFHPHLMWSLMQIMNAVIVLAVLFHLGRLMLSKRADYFSHLIFWTTVSVCCFLSYLSVRFEEEVFIGTYHWTYVKELRYFSPVIFLMGIYLIKNFELRKPRTVFSAFTLMFVGFAAVFGFILNSYYRISNNSMGSFENVSGRVLRANQFFNERKDSNTYFLSLTGVTETNTQATSMVAINGGKVILTYDDLFPREHLEPLFKKENTLAPGKRLIIFLNQNTGIIDSLNPRLSYRIEQNQNGEKFLFVNQ